MQKSLYPEALTPEIDDMVKSGGEELCVALKEGIPLRRPPPPSLPMHDDDRTKSLTSSSSSSNKARLFPMPADSDLTGGETAEEMYHKYLSGQAARASAGSRAVPDEGPELYKRYMQEQRSRRARSRQRE